VFYGVMRWLESALYGACSAVSRLVPDRDYPDPTDSLSGF
jgi:hypothetical protein